MYTFWQKLVFCEQITYMYQSNINNIQFSQTTKTISIWAFVIKTSSFELNTKFELFSLENDTVCSISKRREELQIFRSHKSCSWHSCGHFDPTFVQNEALFKNSKIRSIFFTPNSLTRVKFFFGFLKSAPFWTKVVSKWPHECWEQLLCESKICNSFLRRAIAQFVVLGCFSRDYEENDTVCSISKRRQELQFFRSHKSCSWHSCGHFDPTFVEIGALFKISRKFSPLISCYSAVATSEKPKGEPYLKKSLC